MRVRTLVALAHAGIAAGLTTELDVSIVLDIKRMELLEVLELKRFLQRGIGKEEARRRGLDKEIAVLENQVQMINQAWGRL